MDLQKLISQDEHFLWMQGEAFETLSNCFDVEAEQLHPGTSCRNEKRFGYLLQGCGKIQSVNGTSEVQAGALIGVIPGGIRGHQWSDDVFTAESESVVLWFQRDALEFACYRGCWFHARLIREIQTLLGNEP